MTDAGYINYIGNTFSWSMEKDWVDTNPLGIAIFQDGYIVYGNKQNEKIFGYALKEYETTKDLWMKAVHPDDLPDITIKIKEKLTKDQTVIDRYKCRIICKSGEVKWI